MRAFWLAIGILCIHTIKDINALMCYECNTRLDLECFNLTKMSNHYHLCEPNTVNMSRPDYGKRPLCRKVRQKIKVRDNLIVTKHSCGWEPFDNNYQDICYESRYDDYEEVVCQCFADGCNSSRMKTADSSTVIILSVLSLLSFLYFTNK